MTPSDPSIPIGRDGHRWRGKAVFEIPFMPASYRTLTQFAKNNYTDEEIARACGIRPASVSSMLTVVRKRYKGVLIPFQVIKTLDGSSMNEIAALCRQGLRPGQIVKRLNADKTRIYWSIYYLRKRGILPPFQKGMYDAVRNGKI